MACSVNDDLLNVRKDGRCRFGTGHAGRGDGNANGVVLGVSFPSLVARNLGAFRAKRAGERAWGDGKTGPFIGCSET